MAAIAATQEEKQFVTIAHPGEGMTYVFGLLANYLLTREENKNAQVLIYVSSKVVASQIKDKMAIFETYERIVVTNVWDPARWKDSSRKTYYIIDEADEVIESNLLNISATLSGFNGLIALKTEKVFLYSATLNQYYHKAFLWAFNLPDRAVVTFPSAHQIMTG